MQFRALEGQIGSWELPVLSLVLRNAFIFDLTTLWSVRGYMVNLDARKESSSAQFGSFGYWFYYYFN
jgi:hypothetical protein